jgi:hypothetical protein
LGNWVGGYKPIALRCAPFECRHAGADPLNDLSISPLSPHLSQHAGAPIVDDKGAPSPLVTGVHRLFRLLQEGREKFAEALDQLLIADVLIPLPMPEADSGEDTMPTLHLVNGRRFNDISRARLGAITRHSFAALDVAVACLYSQRLLKQSLRSSLGTRANSLDHDSPPLPVETAGLQPLDLALDDGELVSLAAIDALRDRAHEHAR